MNPLWTATLRRHWPVIGAVGIFIVLAISEQIWFGPITKRHQAVLEKADELGIAVDPDHMPPVLPPRLFALLADNSLPAAQASQRGNSGALTAELLENLTELASQNGMRVIVTEPGPVTQQAEAVQVRAHLKLRCRYDQFVALLEEIARGRTLFSIDRFSLSSGPGGEVLDLWVSRYILKQSKKRK